MCMIAYRPVTSKGAGNIPNSVIDTALTRHPDGYGVAWRQAGQVMTAKFGPEQRKAFRRTLRRLDNAGYEYAAHFRQATHGPAVKRLSHPFTYDDPVEGRVAVLHNGVIDISTQAHESDTEVFVRDVLAQLPSAWWRVPALTYLVGEAIGWSKLVVMSPADTYVLHPDRGTWDDGIWYSSNHKPAYTAGVYTSGKYTSGKGWNGGWSGDSGKATGVVRTDTTTPARQMAKVETALIVREPDADACTVPYSLGRTLRHGGHTLSAVKDIDFSKDGDWAEGVICDTCFTVGDLYVIDGSYYVDMGHKMGLLAEPEDDDEDVRVRDSQETLAELDELYERGLVN